MVRVLRKRWWLVAGAVVVALAAAAALTWRTTPRYESRLTFFVTTATTEVADAYQGGLFSQQRVKSYATLVTSDRLAEAVARTSGTGLGAAAVQARIQAEPQPETVLLDATVTDELPERSLRLASQVAVQAKRLIEELETPPGRTAPAVKVEVVAGPVLDPSPVTPRPLRNYAVAGLLGLLLGGALAALRELLDTSVKTSEELAAAAGAPVLATVPMEGALRDAPQRLVAAAGHTPRSEALRQLRTNLSFVDVDHPVRTVVVTSAVAGEGKSSTACNLATLFAEAGRRVLVVDADLRRPAVAEYLGIEGAAGLTTLIAGQATMDDVIQPYGSRMWVLPSGFQPPNPSELLGSAHLAELLRVFEERYDTVIVDCPPLLPVTDASVVAARADGALLVSRARKTTDAQVRAAAAALRSVDARLLGCVLNMVKRGDDDPYHYYSYGPGPSGRHGGRRAVRDELMPAGAPVSAGR